MAESKLFIGGLGISTNPELDALKAKLPLERGKLYTHEEIAAACGVPYGTNRYMTVVQRWIRWAESAQNIVLISERNIGYSAIQEDQKITVVCDRHKAQHRQYKRAIKMLASANLNDPIQISNRDHHLRLMTAVHDAMNKTTTGFNLAVYSGNFRRELPSPQPRSA